MTIGSNIDTSAIDETFPVPGVNQSSQGFRQNFLGTKNSLNAAKNEILSLQQKTLVVTGDVSGVSSILDSGTTPQTITLSLPDQTNVAGSYSGQIVLTADSKGRITAIQATPWPSLGTPGTYQGSLTGKTLTVPALTLDGSGHLSAVGSNTVDLSALGLIGYSLAHNSLVVGDNSNLSTAFAAPGSTTSNGHYLAYTNAGVLAWTPFPISSGGTVTGVLPGYGIAVDSSTTEPTVNLDTSSLPTMTGTAIGDDDFVLVHNIVADFPGATANAAVKVTWPEFIAQAKIRGPFLSLVSEDTAPTLGGNLNVNAKTITNTGAGGVVIQGGFDKISLDGQLWPKTPGTDGFYLTTTSGGTLVWSALPAIPAGTVTNITATQGIVTTPAGGITSTGSVALSLNTLPDNTLVGTDYLAVAKGSGAHYRIPVSAFVTAASAVPAPQFGPDAVWVQTTLGSDTTGDGSLGKPYATITKALTKTTSGPPKIILLPGIYTENVSVTKDSTFLGLFGRSTVQINGVWTLSNKSLNFSEMTFQPTDSSGTSLLASGGLNSMTVMGCDFLGTDDGTNLLPVISLAGSQFLDVTFSDTLISGLMINNLDPSASPGGLATALYCSDMRFSSAVGLVLHAQGVSRSFIDGLPSMGGIYQQDTSQVTLDNVAEITGVAFPPFNTVPSGATYLYGLVSDASTPGVLIARNVNFRQSMPPSLLFSQINKTGTATYFFDNVTRNPYEDVLADPGQTHDPYRYTQRLSSLDATHPTLYNGTTKTFTVDINALNWDVTISDNQTINLVTSGLPTLVSGALGYIQPFLVIVRQDGMGSHTATWTTDASGGIVWQATGTPPSIPTGPNAIKVLTFYWIPALNQIIGQASTS